MIFLKRNMQTVKLIYNFLDGVFATLWGLAVIDYFAVYKTVEFDIKSLISSGVQSIYIIVGLLYFILSGIYRHQLKQEELKEKRMLNRKMQIEIERIEEKQKKN